MAHQTPPSVPVPAPGAHDDVTDQSTPRLGNTASTLSFINNVQSAVAQIEHRLADSTFAGAVNSDASLLSSGVIISTTPPCNLTSNACDQVDDPETCQFHPQTPSAPVPQTTDSTSNAPAPSIAPIVEHFEAPVPTAFRKEQDSAIVAASIAPIVEHFETSLQPVENINKSEGTDEAADERLTTSVVEQPEAPVSDERAVSPKTGSTDASVEANANTFEKHETISDSTSKLDEPEILATTEAPAAAAGSHSEHDIVTDRPAAQTLPSIQEEVQDDLGQSSKSDRETLEVDNANTTVSTAQRIDDSDGAELNPSCVTDQDSQPLTKVPDEETSVSEERREAVGKRAILGDLSKQASADATRQKIEKEDEHSSPEAISGKRSGPVSVSNISCGESEVPTIPRICKPVDQEKSEAALLSGVNELDSNEAQASPTIGDACVTERDAQSDRHKGSAVNVTATSDTDIHTAAAIGTVSMSDSKTAVTDAGIIGGEQKSANEYKESRDEEQTSLSCPDRDDSNRHELGSRPSEPGKLCSSDEKRSPSEVAVANSGALQEKPGDVATALRKIEKDVRSQESAAGIHGSRGPSREGSSAAEEDDGAPLDKNDTETYLTSKGGDTHLSGKGSQETINHEAREVMAAKAVLARDKLAKLSLGSPVKKPHRSPFLRMTGDARDSSVKTTGIVHLSPRNRRSPTGSKSSSFNQTKRTGEPSTSPGAAILDTAIVSPKQRKLHAPLATSRSPESTLKGLPPRSPVQAERLPPPKSTTGYVGRQNTEQRKALPSEHQSHLRDSQTASGNTPRLPRVAGLTSTRSGPPSTPHSSSTLRARSKIPRAATFSAAVPKSKSALSSPFVGRKVGMASSPVTPSSDEKSSSAPRPPVRRALSFTQSKPSASPVSPGSRAAPSRSRGSDIASTASLPGSKPPRRGARPRVTVPQPFALTGPELHEKSAKQMAEARRRAEEEEARPRVFKPRPMPDFSKPYRSPQSK